MSDQPRDKWVGCAPAKAYAAFNKNAQNCSVEVIGSTIVILPKDGGIGWRYQPGDIGYSTAQRLAEEMQQAPTKD